MSDPLSSGGTCALCEREVAHLTRHHLCPKSEGGVETALICSSCHRQIHALYHNRTLAQQYDTLEKLKRDPDVARYLRWVRKQSDRRIPVHKSKRRR